jgi:hypothetical protein
VLGQLNKQMLDDGGISPRARSLWTGAGTAARLHCDLGGFLEFYIFDMIFAAQGTTLPVALLEVGSDDWLVSIERCEGLSSHLALGTIGTRSRRFLTLTD